MYVRLYLNVKRADAGAVEHRRAKQVTKKKLDICGRVNFVLKSTVLLFEGLNGVVAFTVNG